LSLSSTLGAVALATVAVVALMPTAARAADPITDPRAYCDHAAELVADGKIDELTSDLLAHTHGRILEAEFKAALAGFTTLSVKAGPLRSSEHISEWKAGEAFVRHHYILVYQYGVFFLKCSMYRPEKNWLLYSFAGNTDPDNVGLKNVGIKQGTP
jgi:hypothetical protein